MSRKTIYLIKPNQKFTNYDELMALKPFEVIDWKNVYSDFDDYVSEKSDNYSHIIEDRDAIVNICSMNALETISGYNKTLIDRFNHSQKQIDAFKEIPFLAHTVQDVLKYNEYLDEYKGYIAEEKEEEDICRDFVAILQSALKEFRKSTRRAKNKIVLVLVASY